MNQYLSKTEITDRYYELDEVSGMVDLVFSEGGKYIVVMSYASWNEAYALWEEDALMHWMKVLQRTWNDDEFKEEVETFERRHRREPREEL